MAKLKSIVTAYKAQVNPQVSGMVDIFGAFDNLIQPMFPFPMANLSIVLTFSDLEKFLITERGKYTIDIFEKIAEDKVKFIETADLFIADYPPQRRFADEEIAHILAAEGVIKTVKTEFKPVEDAEPVKIQISLDKNAPLEEGHIAIPENDRITVGDKIFDLTGIRRQIEWMFGNPIPKQPEADPEKQEEENVEKTEEK